MYRNIKNKIRQKILSFLGLTDIEQLRKDADIILKSINVGIDYHYKDDSWAVICIDGNPCYVNFVRLPKEDLRFLMDFLNRYSKSRKVMDMPYFLRQVIRGL